MLSTLLIYGLLATGPALASSSEVFPAQSLRKYATESPLDVFADRKISCHLAALMGEKNLAALKVTLESIDLADDPDAMGAWPFRGGARGLGTISEAIVLIHPDGGL